MLRKQVPCNRLRIITNFHPVGMLLLVSTLLVACDKAPPVTSRNTHPVLHRVEVAEVRERPLKIHQQLASHLQARQKTRIYNEENLRIVSLPFHEGDTVKAGTVLVKLDDSLIKTELNKARAALQQAQADLKRKQGLLDKNLSTSEEVALAKTELLLRQADLDYQLTRLSHTIIKAPFDGVITERLFEPGDFLATPSHILTLIDPKELYAEVSISERLLPLIKVGQNVDVEIDALGTSRYPASISRTFPTIDKFHKGHFEIRFETLPETAKAGQFIRVYIDLQLSQRRLLPTRCIQLEPEGAYVYRIVAVTDDKQNTNAEAGYRVEKVYIEQGAQYADQTVVQNGLNNGDRVVQRGFLGLRDGKKVFIVNSQPTNNPQASHP